MTYVFRKKIRTGLLLGLYVIAAAAGLTSCGEPPRKKYLSSDRIAAWKNDIDYLGLVLPRLHKDLYFHITEDQFMRSLEDMKNRAEYYSDKQMEIAIAEAVAEAGDTHTRSRISAEQMYPIGLHWYSEGIFITDADETHKELLFSRLTAINGIPIEEAARRIEPLLAGSNESWYKNQCVYYLIIPGVLNYYGISESDQIRLSVILSGGEEREIQMRSIIYQDYQPAEIPERETALYNSRPSELYWYEYLPEYKTIYMNYSACRQMRDLPFEIFNKEFWSFAADADAYQLVVDLRNNRGGSSTILHPFIGKLRRSRFNKTGRIWVIIGKDTFSSAVLNSLSLKKRTKAVFIGEDTGGEPNHYGEVKEFKLPNSEISVQYSTKYFHWYDDDTNTLKPDVHIGESFDAEMRGIDPVLEYIINDS